MGHETGHHSVRASSYGSLIDPGIGLPALIEHSVMWAIDREGQAVVR